MSKIRRIGVAVNVQHLHAEDQQLYCGIRQYSREHEGFECVLSPFAEEELKVARRDSIPYDGLLAQASPDLVADAARLGIPVVDMLRNSRVTVPVDCVFPDFAKAGRMAGQHLVSRGFENFGYVINRRNMAQADMCDATLIGGDTLGYASYVEARGFTCARFMASRVVYARSGVWQHWCRRIREWLVEQPKPLGLFVPNDLLCRYIADIAPELGFNVPHDMGLICADNEPNFCLLSSPSLSSIDMGYSQVGYEAAAMLDRMLRKAPKASKKRDILQLEPRALHARHSTDAVAATDPIVASAMRYILEHTGKSMNVSDVARAVSCTRRTLERRFRDVLDRTVLEEITRCRLDRLKRRLAESKEPIKQLVQDSGFNSSRVLYETFVREEGISPSAYRAKRRQGA